MRKLATAAAVTLALTYGNAQALGLGDIEMRSALNQPMNAEIRLTSVKPGEAEGMIVQLASPDAFARAGIERTSALTDLRFSVDRSSGTPVIRITSSRPVVEPFLNFLLEVDWPQGRMVREYTVLLDPPVFMTPSASQQSSADAPATTNPDTVSLLTPTPIERAAPAVSDLDGLSVDVAGGTAEVGNAVAGTPDGESVALDGLFGDSDAAPVSTDSGDVVVLSDLDAPNPQATQQFLEEQALAADVEIPDVELLGGTAEVSDAFVPGSESAIQGAASDTADLAGSEIVSLDDLEFTPVTPSATTGQSASTAAGDTSSAAQSGEITVQRGDTLYSIAQRNAVEGVTLQQMMLALLNANQNAFIDGNINLVKAGATLRIPGQGEATQLTQTQALAEVGKQHQLWQEYRDNLRGASASRVATATVPSASGSTVTDSPAVDSVADASDAAATAESTSGAATAAADTAAEAGSTLSDEAREILESARAEIRQRDELKIVAEQDATTTTASATSPDEEGSPEGQLAELNRKLQLAREELASSRLESGDLDEQVSELQSTSDNLDTLVAMRQNDLARLQAQLEEARSAADTAADSVADAAGDTLAGAADAASDAAEAAAESAGDAVAAASDAAGDAAETVTGAAGDAAAEVNAIAADAAEVTGDVAADAAASAQAVDTSATAPVTPSAPQAWYEGILQDKTRLGIVGVGALGLAGVLGTLLFRRRRRDDDDLLDVHDEVEFIDADEAAELQGDLTADATQAQPKGAAAAAAAAGAAGLAAADDHEAQDATLALDADDEDGVDKDDTLSEVDVYLAYGLHGQAEDLLNKALEKSPNHPDYTVKLLETHHAQGNTESFNQLAESYRTHHGEDNEGWTRISQLGQDLQPGNALYASAAEAVQSVGIGDHSAPKLSDEDFAAEDASEIAGSVNRDFRGSGDASDMVDEESALLDESLDPAFAFDESDLEATGDFSQLSEELKAEDDGSIDFPGISDAADDVKAAATGLAGDAASTLDDLSGDTAGTLDDLGSEASGTLDELAGAVELDDNGLDGSIDFEEFDLDNAAGSKLGDELSLDAAAEGGEMAAMADDLTLDLEQLSGDLELDSTELLDSGLGDDLSELEIPDLTGDNDLLSAGDGDIENADEMDTMMDLAKAYIDMGDKDSASSALDEIVRSGTPAQVSEAETLLRKIS